MLSGTAQSLLSCSYWSRSSHPRLQNLTDKLGALPASITNANWQRHVRCTLPIGATGSFQMLHLDLSAGPVARRDGVRAGKIGALQFTILLRTFTARMAWDPYLSTLKAYKCPNDRIPSDNGERIRSISMNPGICGDLPGQI